MIRFRFTEDERRYLLLRSEIYRIFSQYLEPKLATKVMRNFGKLDQMVHFEGIRQGFAAAELALLMEGAPSMPQARQLKAFQAHATIYGSSDTPLVQVEHEHLENMNQGELATYSGWLDNNPMRFAPQTLAEWEDEQQEEPIVTPDTSPQEQFARLKAENPEAIPYIEDEMARPTADVQAIEEALAPGLEDATSDVDTPPESPQFLDRVRDYLQESSEKYESWQDMIFKLHLGMQVDAGYLDIALSTPAGLTVLAQCNQTHLHPGAEMNIEELRQATE